MTASRETPVLLTMADYFGTLAAARSLGRAGIPVVVAESKWLAVARWSRYVSRRVPCPTIRSADAFLEWLFNLGRSSPGMVLYPTSDETAWLLACHRERLAAHYRLFQPPVETIYALLNKKRLADACRAAGLETPATAFPRSEHDVERCAAEIGYPVLLKPQTQIFFESHVKGRQVSDPRDLVDAYRTFVRDHRYATALLAFDPGARGPMLQRFHAEASADIYSISGFVGIDGEHALRAARKVMQRPRRLGVGICFEAAPVEPQLAERVLTLCRQVGYHGVFEVEFIRADGRHLLIDFNPRFYGQMGFETARGLPLPELVHAAALGDDERVRALLASSRRGDGDAAIFCHRVSFEMTLGLQRVSGRLSPVEHHKWRAWHAKNRAQASDAVLAADDPLPAVVDALEQLRAAVRHPRAFIRSVVLDRQ
jgi:predicted ATP-grasp superfamily ATP-dependent carboligase